MTGKAKENSARLWKIPPLKETDHKYSRGHVLVLGGAVMTGASKLAAVAAQRAGAGVVTLAAPKAAWPVYAAGMLSVITRPLKTAQDWEWILDHRKVSTVLLGPGCEPDDLLREVILHTADRALPLVVDAGALELLAADETLREIMKGKRFVCLPHEGEFKKLASALRVEASLEKSERALTLARAMNGIIVLKGATTIIAAPEGNLVGNHAHTPHLATAGTGDVLAGMVAGLAAQGMELFDAACAGVYLHTKAAESFGHGMIAEDLLGAIPNALKSL